MVTSSAPSIVAVNGVRVGHLVARQVVRELGQQLRHGLAAPVPDQLERRNELLRPQAVAVPVDAPASFVTLEDRDEDLVQERLRVVHANALTRELDRRLEEIRPRKQSVAGVSRLQAGHETGDGDRLLADVEHLRRGVGEVDHELLHRPERSRRHREEAVEHDRVPARFPHDAGSHRPPAP